jgi:hypothetical protein
MSASSTYIIGKRYRLENYEDFFEYEFVEIPVCGILKPTTIGNDYFHLWLDFPAHNRWGGREIKSVFIYVHSDKITRIDFDLPRIKSKNVF